MAEAIAAADIETLYSRCLFIHNGVLVKVLSIEFGPTVFTLLNLSTGKKFTAPFKQEDFKVPEKRIGFVNVMRGVLYVVRQPQRKFHLGININNIEIQKINALRVFPDGASDAMEKVKRLECVEIYNAYAGKYPSLKEAVDNAVEWKGACAFDKQFAVTKDRDLFYKTKKVGVVDDYTIKFDPNFEYLNALLENNYEKASRNFKCSSL
jgi:hypothetical protein